MSKVIPALLLTVTCALALGVAAADEPAAAEDTPTVAVVTTPGEKPPGTHLSRAGLGSLYWAARHPAEAWRVLMPVQEGSVAYADIRARCAMISNAPSGQAACP